MRQYSGHFYGNEIRLLSMSTAILIAVDALSNTAKSGNAFVLQNMLYGSLLQNCAQREIPILSIFVHFGSFQDVFSLLKGGKFFTDP